jgi:hypothetical protein
MKEWWLNSHIYNFYDKDYQATENLGLKKFEHKLEEF